ncbi:2891_t:CDS:1, partial [Acaulospora colombiana]
MEEKWSVKRSLALTWDRTSEPTAVVEGGKATTPLWGSDLNDVGRSSASHDGYTETENETAGNELLLVVSRGNDCRSTVRKRTQ